MPSSSVDLDEATACVTSDPERSLEISERYLEKHPDDPRGLFCRFQTWEVLAEFENALADIDRYIALESNWLGYFSRGCFFHDFGHYGRAVDDLTKARELDGEGSAKSSIALYRADSLARLGRLDEALADCALVADDHWMPALHGLPEGNKQEFTAEIRRRAARAQRR